MLFFLITNLAANLVANLVMYLCSEERCVMSISDARQICFSLCQHYASKTTKLHQSVQTILCTFTHTSQYICTTNARVIHKSTTTHQTK